MIDLFEYSDKNFSTWNLDKLGEYIFNGILLTGAIEGAENQVRLACNSLKNRSLLERQAVITSLKKRGDKIPTEEGKAKIRNYLFKKFTIDV